MRPFYNSMWPTSSNATGRQRHRRPERKIALGESITRGTIGCQSEVQSPRPAGDGVPGPRSQIRRSRVQSRRRRGQNRGRGARRPGPHVKAFDRRSRRPQRAKTGNFLYELCDLLFKSGPDTYGRAPEAGKHLTGSHVRNRAERWQVLPPYFTTTEKAFEPPSHKGHQVRKIHRDSPNLGALGAFVVKDLNSVEFGHGTGHGTQERPSSNWARVKERDGTESPFT